MNQTIEEKIASNEKRYRLIAQSLIDTVWVIDPETFNFLYISPDAHETRGYTQKELIGQHADVLFSDDSFARLQTIAKEATTKFEMGITQSYKIETEIIKKNKSKTWIEISAKIVRDDDDGKLKIIVLYKDINLRKNAEHEKEKILEELEKALEEKETLINHIKQLESLLPICSSCRRIRDSKDKKWWPFEKYIEEKSNSKFSHTVCPDCQEIL
ncbi:MAG: PAS domain-containing protein, partial [Desulfobacteraceae bacterium]